MSSLPPRPAASPGLRARKREVLALPKAPRPLQRCELWLISSVLPEGPGVGARGGGKRHCPSVGTGSVTMSPPEGQGGGDMLLFTECHFLQSPRIAGKEVPFLPESPVPPLPALPWASPQALAGPSICFLFSCPRLPQDGLPVSPGRSIFLFLVKFCLLLALEHRGGNFGGPTWAQLCSGLASGGLKGGESCPALQGGSAQKVRPVDTCVEGTGVSAKASGGATLAPSESSTQEAGANDRVVSGWTQARRASCGVTVLTRSLPSWPCPDSDLNLSRS